MGSQCRHSERGIRAGANQAGTGPCCRTRLANLASLVLSAGTPYSSPMLAIMIMAASRTSPPRAWVPCILFYSRKYTSLTLLTQLVQEANWVVLHSLPTLLLLSHLYFAPWRP